MSAPQFGFPVAKKWPVGDLSSTESFFLSNPWYWSRQKMLFKIQRELCNFSPLPALIGIDMDDTRIFHFQQDYLGCVDDGANIMKNATPGVRELLKIFPLVCPDGWTGWSPTWWPLGTWLTPRPYSWYAWAVYVFIATCPHWCRYVRNKEMFTMTIKIQ